MSECVLRLLLFVCLLLLFLSPKRYCRGPKSDHVGDWRKTDRRTEKLEDLYINLHCDHQPDSQLMNMDSQVTFVGGQVTGECPRPQQSFTCIMDSAMGLKYHASIC